MCVCVCVLCVCVMCVCYVCVRAYVCVKRVTMGAEKGDQWRIQDFSEGGA